MIITTTLTIIVIGKAAKDRDYYLSLYIYIERDVYVKVYLSLSIYIYIYIYKCTNNLPPNKNPPLIITSLIMTFVGGSVFEGVIVGWVPPSLPPPS